MPPNPQHHTTAHNHKSQTHQHHPKSQIHSTISNLTPTTWLREVSGKLWRTRWWDQRGMRDYALRSAVSCGERGGEIGGNNSGGRRSFRPTIWFWYGFGRTHWHCNPPPKLTKIQTHRNHPIPKSQPTPVEGGVRNLIWIGKR